MERMFDVPHTLESQNFVASGSTTKNTDGRKGDISWVWLFYKKYLKMVSQANVRKTFYVLVKFVLKRGSR
ncbi:hypothetical protein KSS87_013878, partial [Heliosperma pusillum]